MWTKECNACGSVLNGSAKRCKCGWEEKPHSWHNALTDKNEDFPWKCAVKECQKKGTLCSSGPWLCSDHFWGINKDETEKRTQENESAWKYQLKKLGYNEQGQKIKK